MPEYPRCLWRFPPEDVLHFGPVKGHIGHTGASASVTGIIKALLMMQHNTILGQASYSNLNPKIPALEPDMMAIPRKSQPWKASSKLACINSYGTAGSNAVVAVREVTSVKPRKRSVITARQPFFISASSEASLIAYTRKPLAYVEVQRPSSANTVHLLSDLLFKSTDRSNHRLAYLAAKTLADLKDLEMMIKNIIAGSEIALQDFSSSPRPVVMVFGSQENNFIGLSEEAVEKSALLRFHLDTCDFSITIAWPQKLISGYL